MRMRAAIVVLGLTAALPAQAQTSACRVKDPTGTPLNVRTAPDGIVIGAIENGRAVTILDFGQDRTERPWAFVSEQTSGRPLGWVSRRFLACE